MEYVVTSIIVFPCLIIEGLVGVYFYFFTPKYDPNYGFRTRISVSSEEKWNFSNKKMGLYLLILSITRIVIFIPILIFLLKKYFVWIVSLFPILEVILLGLTIFVVNTQTKKCNTKQIE